ncbi:MAG: septum site-determining protein MinC [Gammaproteobacteria bacterium]|nr:septum site-determining protein MinC [Gammaproteobacteria bacterium]
MPRSDTKDTQDLFPAEPHAHESAIELRGSVFTLSVLRIHSNELDVIESQLVKRLSKSPQFFVNAPIVVDLESVRDIPAALDFHRFVVLLRARHLFPVGVQNGSALQYEAAMAAGLAVLKGRAMKEPPAITPLISSQPDPIVSADTEAVSQTQAAPDDRATPASNTKIVQQAIRSGQRVMARNSDLIVLAAVNAGAEIIAEGNIHVYAPLRGRALAGVSGDTQARIFCHQFEAELVAIAGNYRVFDDGPPKELRGKAVQVFLDGEQLIVAPLD